MSYAEGRTYLDADSHIMELPDFLTSNAPQKHLELVPRVPVEGGARSADGFELAIETRAQPADKVEEMIALGDELISGPKGYFALGAFNKDERTQALNQLGFDRQLVFSTFSAPMCFNANSNEARYASAAAHNRGIAEFCADDDRLMGVGALPLDDPQLAVAEVDHLIELGLTTAWVPHRPAGGRSPGHTDLDPVWARLADAGIPFVLHVGGQPLQIHPDWMNTGRPVPTDWLGGGENIRSKDMTALHHDAETFLGTMVLDGVFERHPNLRGAAVELGAGWVPSFLRRLDWSSEIWRKSEPELQNLVRKPSEQLTTQMAFTPFVYEDVGTLVNESNNELYLFSSDYPHQEGGRNPLGRFERSLDGHTAETLDRFYAENFSRVFGI
jgi:predicted TIM-barrel fold metal-dependent hydrolase